MMIGARTAAWGGKPLPYLRRVAYLESHGTEFIDTGLVDATFYEIECKWIVVQNNKDIVPLGSRVSWPVESFYFICSLANLAVYLALYTGNSVGMGPKYFPSVGDVIVQRVSPFFTINNYMASFNGSLRYASTNYKGFIQTFPLTFFKCNNTTWSQNPVRICYVSMKNADGNFVHNYIPVLDISGRPAMYDEVSGQFFYNQGTGEFTWGELDEA